MRGKFLMGAFLGVSLGVYSQGIGIEEILNRVENGNTEVLVQDLEIKLKEKNEKKAFRNLILPPITISSENDWEIAKKEGFGFEEIEAYIPVFQGGKILNTYKRSKKDLQLAKVNKDIVLYKWQEESVDEYFKYLDSKEQKKITLGATKALEKQKTRLSGLYREGKMIPKSEVLKVEASIENNKAINMKNIQREKSSKENLMQLLGYSLDKNIELKDFNTKEYLKSIESLEKKEKAENTVLGKAEEYKVDLAEYDVKIAKGDMYPSLYIKPSHEFRRENTYKKSYENVNEGRVEVGFRYTFAWGATLDNIAQKEYQLDQSKLKYDNNIKGIDLRMRNKLREIEALKGQSLAQEKRINLLKENLNIDTLRYDNELVTTFDYLNSVNELRVAQGDYYEVQRKLVLSVIEYNNLYK